MALGDELAVLTGACALCVQCARTRTLLRNSMPRFAVVVACMPHALGNHMPRRMVASAWAPNAEAIGSERDLLLNLLKSHYREDAKVPGAEATRRYQVP